MRAAVWMRRQVPPVPTLRLSALLARTAHVHGMSLVWLEAAPQEEPAYRRTGFPVAGQKLWTSRR